MWANLHFPPILFLFFYNSDQYPVELFSSSSTAAISEMFSSHFTRGMGTIFHFNYRDLHSSLLAPRHGGGVPLPVSGTRRGNTFFSALPSPQPLFSHNLDPKIFFLKIFKDNSKNNIFKAAREET
jgi:hypothetical protein